MRVRAFISALACLAASAIYAMAPAPQAAGGTIKGRVHLTGKLPGNPLIRMGMDPKCSQMNKGKQVVQEYVLAAVDGSLANAFVYLKGSFPQTPVPSQPVLIDQKSCVYGPRVVGARVGQTVQVKNSDDLLHNVDGLSGKGNGFNVGQPRAGQVYEFKPKSEEVMLHLKCDVHNWMHSYVGILSHPYFAVSAAAGTFQIDRVPPGTYTIETWHEKLGVVTKTVTVKAGAVTTIDLAYSGSS